MRRLLTKLSNQWHSHPDDCWPSGLEVVQQLRSRTARPVMWYLTTVHDLSPFLVLHTTAEKPLSSSWCALKWQQILKTWEITFFLPPSSSLPPYCYTATNTPSPLLVWNLISAAWSVWEFWPSPGVACHIQLWAPNKKRRSHTCPLFSYYPTGASIKNKTQKKKDHSLFWKQTVVIVLLFDATGKKKMREEIQMLRNFFFSPSVFCKLAVTQFSKSFVFLFFLFPSASQVTFQCRDIPSETLRLHNLKKKKKRQKDEANLLLPPLPLPLALTLFLSLAAGVWYNSLNVVIADSRLRWRENRRGVASLSDPDNATFLPV